MQGARPYYFRAAIVDQANNIYDFISDANIVDPSYGHCTGASGMPVTTDMDLMDGCQYRAMPGTPTLHQ